MTSQFLNYFLSAYIIVLGAIIGWFIYMFNQEKHWIRVSASKED